MNKYTFLNDKETNKLIKMLIHRQWFNSESDSIFLIQYDHSKGLLTKRVYQSKISDHMNYVFKKNVEWEKYICNRQSLNILHNKENVGLTKFYYIKHWQVLNKNI